MTKEQKAEQIRALLREKEGYEKYGLDERAKAVEAELRRLGHNAKPPAKRAAKMQAKGGTEL